MTDNLRGALLMVLAMAGFALEDTLIKSLAAGMPLGQILLIIGVGGSLVFAGLCRARGFALWNAGFLASPILFRNGFEMFGTFCFVTALSLSPLSTVSAILQAAPLVVVLGASVFLGETVGWRRWSAILVGLCGVLLILRPGMQGFEGSTLWAVAGMLGLAGRDIAVRRVSLAIPSLQLAFLGFVSVIPVGAALLWLHGESLVTPTGGHLVWWFMLIILGVAAYYAITSATRIGDVGFVTPFRYTRLVFAMILGVWVFGERPDLWTLLGATIIVGSGLYALWREQHLR